MTEVMKERHSAAVKCRKLPIVQYYQRLYFNEHVRAPYEVDWAVKHQERLLVVANGGTVPEERGAKLALQTVVATRLWNEETEEFRKSIVDRQLAEVQTALEDKEKLQGKPVTSEDYKK